MLSVDTLDKSNQLAATQRASAYYTVTIYGPYGHGAANNIPSLARVLPLQLRRTHVDIPHSDLAATTAIAVHTTG